jgi:hypothetical protein
LVLTVLVPVPVPYSLFTENREPRSGTGIRNSV